MSEYPFQTTVRVHYRDVDMQKVVHNSNYLHYAEIGRVEYLRHRGMTYQEVVARFGIEMVLAESHCYFKKPARFDNLLEIRVGIGNVRNSSFKVAYEIYHPASEDVIALIRTHHVCVDGETFKPVRIPEEV
ncbi:MAG: YbgC/FadM family acyl-CoA thioesterase, partial [Candidatus Marinimicrobia bacterium]|nr:YbgC/FadM family acyl-CoA thioesterase [Candidatus Neomarinimicrobiota bacterium]